MPQVPSHGQSHDNIIPWDIQIPHHLTNGMEFETLKPTRTMVWHRNQYLIPSHIFPATSSADCEGKSKYPKEKEKQEIRERLEAMAAIQRYKSPRTTQSTPRQDDNGRKVYCIKTVAGRRRGDHHVLPLLGIGES